LQTFDRIFNLVWTRGGEWTRGDMLEKPAAQSKNQFSIVIELRCKINILHNNLDSNTLMAE
jgi:hypothetical protein